MQAPPSSTSNTVQHTFNSLSQRLQQANCCLNLHCQRINQPMQDAVSGNPLRCKPPAPVRVHLVTHTSSLLLPQRPHLSSLYLQQSLALKPQQARSASGLLLGDCQAQMLTSLELYLGCCQLWDSQPASSAASWCLLQQRAHLLRSTQNLILTKCPALKPYGSVSRALQHCHRQACQLQPQALSLQAGLHRSTAQHQS